MQKAHQLIRRCAGAQGPGIRRFAGGRGRRLGIGNLAWLSTGLHFAAQEGSVLNGQAIRLHFSRNLRCSTVELCPAQ